jgi:hypothetical protein
MKERILPNIIEKGSSLCCILGLTERAAITAIGYHEASIESIRIHGCLNELELRTNSLKQSNPRTTNTVFRSSS